MEIITQLDPIDQFIIRRLKDHPSDISAITADFHGISRQAAHKRVRRLIGRGVLEAVGSTRRIYSLRYEKWEMRLELSDARREDFVWRQHVRPELPAISGGAESIWAYGFTEMFNNALDHSESKFVDLMVRRTALFYDLYITDYGVGIFNKIQKACELPSKRQAVFELSKGKLTTDPSRHTGEGIFFTSRMFDGFSITSSELFLGRLRAGSDWLLEDPTGPGLGQEFGTMVHLNLETDSDHTMREVFDRYATNQEDYGFNRTHVHVALADMEGGMALVSRSQAKRILARLEKFKEAVLDFSQIEDIGPAFADEIFRVFARDNPGVNLVPINMNSKVEQMVQRGRNSAIEDEAGS